MRKLNVLGIISTIVAYTILSGCSNPTDAIIEDAKHDSWFDGYAYEDRFNYVIKYLDDTSGKVEVVGHSIEDEVIVLEFDCDAKENYERYDGWTLERVHNLFVALSQYILDSADLHDVTVYVEYYMGGERIAVSEITTRDDDLTLD